MASAQPMSQPIHLTPTQIKAARLHAGHSQTQAAAAIHSGRYQTWTEYESGKKPMPPALAELYLLITDQHPALKVTSRA